MAGGGTAGAAAGTAAAAGPPRLRRSGPITGRGAGQMGPWHRRLPWSCPGRVTHSGRLVLQLQIPQPPPLLQTPLLYLTRTS